VQADAAVETVKRLWKKVGLPYGDAQKQAMWEAGFAPDAVVEDLYLAQVPEGPGAGVRAYLENKASCGTFVMDRISDGETACGFTWHLEEDGVEGIGIRGTTFVEVDTEGRVCYLREICEPLYKPGDSTVELLKAIGGDNVATFGDGAPVEKRTPSGASDLCKYLWKELQGRAPPSEAVSFFAEDALYEDFNYEMSMSGKAEIGDFLEKFAEITALKFAAERFSDGDRACCFTWSVEIAGVSSDAPNIRGISFYELDDSGKIAYVRDIPESVMKPPPLQAMAAALRPKLRVFQPRKVEAEGPCNCANGTGVEWPTGECVDGAAVLAQVITGADGVDRTVGSEVAGADGGVVIFMRHLG